MKIEMSARFGVVLFCICFAGALKLNAAEYEITEGSYTVPADATKVTKTGSGMVSLDANSTASSVRFDVKTGTLVVPSSTLRLGTSTPLVYVDEGATLWCSNLAVQGGVQMNLHLSGTVKLSPNGSYAKARATTLESDSATAIVNSNCSGMWEVSHTLDMQSHTFNINGYGCRKNNDYNNWGGYLLIGTIKNNGDFNLGENAELIFYGDRVSYGGTITTKTITIGDKAEVMFSAKKKSSDKTTVKKAIPYGLVANGDAYVTSDSYNGDASGNFKGANTFLGAVRLNKDSTLTAYTRYNENMLFAAGVNGAGTLKKVGTANLFVTGNVESVVNKIEISRGTLALEDGMHLMATNGASYLHYNVTELGYFYSLPRLYVDKSSSFAAKGSGQILRVGNDLNSYGMVDVVGGVVSNYLNLGNIGSGHLRVSGGEFYWQGNNKSSANQIASNAKSYSTIVITNGNVRFSTNSGYSVGNGSSTIVIAEDAGFYPDYSHYYAGGYNNIYVAGTFYDKNSAYVGNGVSTEGGLTLTLDGENADYYGYAFWLHSDISASAKYTAQVNINRGVFRPTNFSRRTNSTGRKDRLFLTANGGTFKRTLKGEYQGDNLPADKIVVYKGGIKIDASVTDNDTAKIYVRTPIEAPTGKGVKSVTLPESILSRTNYPGPAKLVITTTRGEGFTAICEYEPIFDSNDDRKYGRVTGVKVTCPGWDFEDESDITVKVYYPLPTIEPAVCTVELEDNVNTADFTKIGNSELVLDATNTICGVTRVLSGTLTALCDGALKGTTDIFVSTGAVLNLYGNDMTVNTVSGVGLINNGAGDLTIHELRVAMADADAGKRLSLSGAGKLVFADDAKIVITDYNSSMADSPSIACVAAAAGFGVGAGRSINEIPVVDANGEAIDGWLLRKNGDTMLKVGKVRGTMIFFK